MNATIDQLKTWVKDPEFNAQLNSEIREEVFRIASSCNCNWTSVLNKIITQQPDLLTTWAANHLSN